MLVEIIGLVLWTGIIGITCFLSHRRKVKHDAAVHEINENLRFIREACENDN